MFLLPGNGDVIIGDCFYASHRPRIVVSLDEGTLGEPSFDSHGFMKGLYDRFPQFDLDGLAEKLSKKGERHFGPGTKVQILGVDSFYTSADREGVAVEVGVIVSEKRVNKRQGKVGALNQTIWRHFESKPGERGTDHCSMGQQFIVHNILKAFAWEFKTSLLLP